MSAIENFTTNLPSRSLSRRGGILGIGQTGAGLWDDSLNFADTFLTETQDVLRVAIPAESHAAGSLSNLWNSPPGYSTTSTTVRVPPPSVTDQSYRNARGVLRENYYRSTDVLNGITRIARYTFIVTKINTIWQFGHSLYNFHQDSARWRTTLEAFRDDPTPENLAAYGIASGNMVNDISNMVNNIPASPTGSIPFYGNIFTNVGNFTTTLIGILGSRLSTIDRTITEAEREGSAARHRGARASPPVPD